MTGLATLAAAAALVLPQSSSDASPVVLPDIVVQSTPVETQAKAFVAAVSAPFPQATLARWNQAICPAVVNLERGLSSIISDRVRDEARSLRVRVGDGACRANVIIVATDAADLTAQGLVRDDFRSFHPGDSGTDLGRSALRRFQNSDAAVRWWHVAMPVSDDTGKLAIALDGEAPPVVADRVVTRLRANIRYDMAWVIIVIDVTKTAQVPASSLADYIAMVALAQIDPQADFTAHDTVLNLFAPGAALHGMTEWDHSYLSALYDADANAANFASQKDDMERSLADGLRRRRSLDEE
ncbi:Uncharacterised protein [Brevundimonas vesicularis]|uniref:DUF2927 domain-containing protein n=1 Tax=Brevundimonas vesicularis TaxID=41276 RepID=A0A2X1B5I9_BREVE|nr:hypothetical protein [Brevundimonas vesicularis]SPU52523.1 Uncharacterised protein [Brevundimonas vesicularis]